jgi:hypothetical protein
VFHFLPEQVCESSAHAVDGDSHGALTHVQLGRELAVSYP